MASETVPLLRLIQTKGIGPRSLAKLLDRLERRDLALQDFLALVPEEMTAQFDMREEQAIALQANESTATQLAQILEGHGIRTLSRSNPDYPTRMKGVLADKAPPVLFVAGAIDLLQDRAVGFCGSRDASEEGLRSAEKLARSLANEGLLVVSGHAQGVDEAAHRAALEAGGATALVLPEGILHFRPRPSLGAFLCEDRFVVVSEFPPSLPWSVSNAMQRNRTICGLVNALIVIEAGASGGTWEAGLEALKLGVPLFVLDFDQPMLSAPGNPLLVKKGGVPLPCTPGAAPDASPLRRALDAEQPRARAPSLF
ncbi:MAG: DNA-processing protein DprA [Gemmataceae bacterium]